MHLHGWFEYLSRKQNIFLDRPGPQPRIEELKEEFQMKLGDRKKLMERIENLREKAGIRLEDSRLW